MMLRKPTLSAAARIRSAGSPLLATLAAICVAGALASSAAASLPASTPVPSAAVHTRVASLTTAKRKACPAGHLLLALRGPGVVTPQQPTSYTFVARPCGGRRVHTLSGVRLYVRGPQAFAWVIARLRPRAVARKT